MKLGLFQKLMSPAGDAVHNELHALGKEHIQTVFKIVKVAVANLISHPKQTDNLIPDHHPKMQDWLKQKTAQYLAIKKEDASRQVCMNVNCLRENMQWQLRSVEVILMFCL